MIAQLRREEYETWQLVNELIFSENLYFETKQQAGKKDHCPKTAEIQMLTGSHNACTIHAVAHWLEKIYAVDERVRIKPLAVA